MNELRERLVVRSLSGRDKGTLLAVLKLEEGYCLLADGKRRPLESPKRKKLKHLKATEHCVGEECLRGNKALKKALSQIAVKTFYAADIAGGNQLVKK